MALARLHCWMHYEIREQDASSSDPPTTGSTVTRRLPKEDRVPAEGGRAGASELAPAQMRPSARGGETLPYLLAREDHIRFPGAQPHEPWHDTRGRPENDLGSRQLSTARYPGHADGPVLQHRPDGTPPRLWTELEGLAM